MAYATGTVTGMKALFDTVVSFATSNGWTLLDTVNSYNDKVLSSTGSSGTRNLIYRVQAQPRYLDISGVTGTFAAGDTITGGTSTNTALVVDVAPTVLTVIDNNGMFQAGETITAAPSGASATVVSRVRYDQILAPNFFQNAADHIVVRGYNAWDTATNTGANEYSIYGKFVWVFRAANGTVPLYAVPDAVAAKAPLNGSSSDTNIILPPGGAAAYEQNGVSAFFYDGRRLAGGAFGSSAGYSGGHSNLDVSETLIQYSANFPYFNPLNTSAGSDRGIALAFDRNNDNWTRYADQRTTGGVPNYFWRWDWNTNSWTVRATNSAYSGTGRYTKFVWDGDNFVYMMNGGSGATGQQFGRYDISANTWSAPGTLANCPNTNDSFNSASPLMWYIPKGAIPGATSDEVWTWNGSPSSTINRYNVNANTWSGLAGVPWSQDNTFTSGLVWDNERYFYNWRGTSDLYYRLDLQNIGAGWSVFSLSSVAGASSGSNQTCSMLPMNQFVGNIRGRAQQPVTYWMVGDADTITVVTKVVDNYYWMQFGLASSFYSDVRTTVTAPATPVGGGLTTVSVASTTGFAAGQQVLAFNPTTGAYVPVTIFAITGPTTFTSYLTAALTSGMAISQDHNCSIVTGDSYFATMASDAGGYGSDAPNLTPSYRIAPDAPLNWLPRSGPTARGEYQLWPLMVYQNFGRLETYETRAKLRQISVLRKVTGGPQSEDLVQIGGSQYIAFYPENYQYTIDSQYLVAIGPI